jgi:hypothetical protein
MAFLSFAGAETGHIHLENLTLTGTTQTFDTGTKRSGTRSFKFDSSAACYLEQGVTAAALNRSYFGCAHFLLPAATGLPSTATTTIVQFATGTDTPLNVALTSGGKIQLRDHAGAQIGSDSVATIGTDTWYRIEFEGRNNSAGSDVATIRLDGVQVATGAPVFGANVPNRFRFGWVTDPGTSEVIFFDDIALKDDTGSVHNTWIGQHAVRVLLPTADSSDGNWTDGAGGTASVFEGVNNTPPVGVATTASGANNQIENANATVPNNYDATMQTYTAAGVTGTVAALFGVWEGGSSSTTGSDTINGSVVSNPAVAAASSSVDIVAGTYPASWIRGATAISENPSVTLGTAPVMRVTKTVSSTRINTVCYMGIMVDEIPTPPATIQRLRPVMHIG